jgi:Asp-tRNA(Asn)/Glu-tRNA(Gln) amidotransferase A subunit family amidase
MQNRRLSMRTSISGDDACIMSQNDPGQRKTLRLTADLSAAEAETLLEELQAAENLFALNFEPHHRSQLPKAVRQHQDAATAVRELNLPNELAPASVFAASPARGLPQGTPATWQPKPAAEKPLHEEDIPYASIDTLAAALRRGDITATALARLFLSRLEAHQPTLLATATLLPERALKQAAAADAALARGDDLGPLHGIPYLAKDLLALPEGVTGWGATPYRDQHLDETATVIGRLDAAGAVLLGKASLGALAMDDVWYGGQTKNPWDLEQGSSGSSAGSASAVSAGLVPFAIGSETMGSILSPSMRCHVAGLRPTFGRVSRHGAMALSWSLDKLGPIARSARDTHLVLSAIHGRDARDDSSVDAPLPWPEAADVHAITVAAPQDALDAPTAAMAAFLEQAATLGIEVKPVQLPDLPSAAIMTLLMVEASAAFDALVRSPQMDALVRQNDTSWPNLMRAARFVSAPDYVQLQRLQRRIRDEMDALFETVDVVVTPSGHDAAMLLGNAAGVPALGVPTTLAPTGQDDSSVALLGRAFHEHALVALADAIESARGPLGRPPGF